MLKVSQLPLVALLCLMLNSLTIAQEFDGYAMYTDGNSAFLIDQNTNIAHRWNFNDRSNYAMFMKDNGNIVRGAVHNGNFLNGAAVGGKVQEVEPNGNVVWEFVYSTNDRVSHHDITPMPNGGVLLTAWEVPPLSDLQGLGYQGNSVKYPTHFVEVQQDGTGGKIVWEWHMQDHFVQDVDASLPGFGVISENPQLMDINVTTSGTIGGPPGSSGDWFHVNGIDYDEEYDQIIFSSRFLSEIFIIDHSTTTEEAAGHTGGNSGMGGDFLWRWGNPANYGQSGNKNITAAVHDTRFIPNDGRPFAGDVQIFNNEGVAGQSQIDVIELPRDGFNFIKEDNQEFAPAAAKDIHFTLDRADGQSASFRLPNGNLYVNLSRRYQYEVDLDENLVWQYSEAGSKGFRVTCAHPGVQRLISDGVLDNTFCDLSSTDEIFVNPYTVSPNPSTGIFKISDIVNDQSVQNITVTNSQGELILKLEHDVREINLTDFDPAIYFLSLNYTDRKPTTKRIILTK